MHFLKTLTHLVEDCQDVCRGIAALSEFVCWIEAIYRQFSEIMHGKLVKSKKVGFRYLLKTQPELG